jgi:uncharacterized protein DUF4124
MRMISRVLRVVLPAVLAASLGLPPPAHADIYTWVDASGALNVSNLPPPEGAQVTKILRGPSPEIVAREDAARDAAREADAQALAERVRQLEAEVAAQQSPPPGVYSSLPAPPVIQPVIQYVVEPPSPQISDVTPAYPGCDPSWAGCALSWFPGFYPASIVVVTAPRFRGAHPVRPHNPMHPPRSPFALPKLPSFTAQLPSQPFGSTPGPKRG